MAIALLLAPIGCGAAEEAPLDHVEAEAHAADTEAVAGVALVVDGEGLRIVDGATGSTTPLSFGTDSAVLLASLTRIIGRPPDERGPGVECGPVEYATWEDGISVWTGERGFVGWSMLDADSPLTTMSGIGIGTTLAEIEEVMVVELMETTIGREFVSGGLAGLLGGPGPDAPVTHLWAGETCIAR